MFPLVPRGKLPLIPTAHPARDRRRGCKGECGRDGHGLHDASSNPRRVARWWSKWPNANVALRTGVVFDAIDIDSTEALDALNAIRGDRPTTAGPAVKTRNGWHLYHRPSGHGNKAGVIPGVDFRGKGGYVVAPPSVHPSGHVYEWGEVDSADAAIEPLPEWFVQLLAPPVQGQHATKAITAGAYGRRALEVQVGRLSMAQVGTRNHQLNRSAFELGQLVAGGELDASEVVDALVGAAVRIGLGTIEIEKSIHSGLAGGMRQPRSAKT